MPVLPDRVGNMKVRYQMSCTLRKILEEMKVTAMSIMEPYEDRFDDTLLVQYVNKDGVRVEPINVAYKRFGGNYICVEIKMSNLGWTYHIGDNPKLFGIDFIDEYLKKRLEEIAGEG